MRVFVTGATGYIGSAIVAALVRAGHRVTGLSRSAEKDAVVRRLGAEPARGALGAIGALAPLLDQHDGLVHAAIDYGLGPPADREAIEAFLAAAARGGPRSVVYTSGVWVLGPTPPGQRADEGTRVDHPAAAVAWRPAHERLVFDADLHGVAAAVVRPGMVYGGRPGGIVGPALFGGGGIVGDGENRWSLVHRDDLAELYRLLVEAGATGPFHGVDGAPTKLADAARAASAAAGKGGAFRSIPLEDARRAMGPVADALVMDQAVTSSRGLELGWRPTRPSFVERAAEGFREWSAAG
jgi:nucleoside-diphosphate-sugar epimerase